MKNYRGAKNRKIVAPLLEFFAYIYLKNQAHILSIVDRAMITFSRLFAFLPPSPFNTEKRVSYALPEGADDDVDEP